MALDRAKARQPFWPRHLPSLGAAVELQHYSLHLGTDLDVEEDGKHLGGKQVTVAAEIAAFPTWESILDQPSPAAYLEIWGWETVAVACNSEAKLLCIEALVVMFLADCTEVAQSGIGVLLARIVKAELLNHL
jgi:hypothetical protein